MFIQAITLDEALKARARHPEARFVAGGTTTIPEQNLGRFQPEGYISLRRIPCLRRIEDTGDGLFLGAGRTMADLLTNPLLEDQPMIRLAARTTGTRQLRSRSTVGGNLFTDPDGPHAAALSARARSRRAFRFRQRRNQTRSR